MRILLDTHALLWWWAADRRLSAVVRAAIDDRDNMILVSAASIWEIATKSRVGRLPGLVAIAHRVPDVVEEEGFEPVPITPEDAHRAGWLAGEHRDPFDRMLVAQAQLRGLTIATRDAQLAKLGAATLW